MALITVYGQDPAKATVSAPLSSSFLGAGNYVQVSRSSTVDLWCDDSAIALVYKFSFDGGANFSAEMPLAAGSVYTAEPGPGAVLTIDVKAASGTPNLGIAAY